MKLGSLLGICLVIQIVTGLFLAIHYCPNIDTAFDRVRHICRDVNYGWILRTIHANWASLFFVCIYLHTGRNIYYGSYNFIHTWSVGVASSWCSHLLLWNSTCLGQFLWPSTGVFCCTLNNGICYTGLLTACSHAVSKPLCIAVRTVWRWTEELSETCGVPKWNFEKSVHLVGFIYTKCHNEVAVWIFILCVSWYFCIWHNH